MSEADDGAKITDVIATLALQVDARRWADLEVLFASQVSIDYSSPLGGEPEIGGCIGPGRGLAPYPVAGPPKR